MEIIMIILLLIIAAEATYLVAVNTKKMGNKKAGRPIFVDTSVLIDGRIIAIAQSGFIGSDTLYIPRSVIGELQYLADNADSEKRGRARHGLDIVTELQAMPNVKVEIFQDGSKAAEGVDERLLKLAKQYNGVVCTIDYNLNKVAQVEDIIVLNVNDLAMSLRMAYLPGEKILLDLTQKGQDGHQAVGHLTDGTMVVVEHASKLIGKTAEIEFIRSLQTAAGKMMFAKLVDGKKGSDHSERPYTKKQHVTPATRKQVELATEVPQQPVATAFHSDRNDQRLAGRSKTPSRQPRQQRVESSAPERQNPNTKQPKKIRTSAQNEANLIKLLNSQED
jgi:rRNA-processing protein FCF1